MRLIGEAIGMVLKGAILVIIVIALLAIVAWRNLFTDDPI